MGINPSPYSVQRGHYFARPTSRFWPAFSRSRLSAPARLALGVDLLGPDHDAALLPYGIGFTDVVKRPTPGRRTSAPRSSAPPPPSSCSAWSATARAWPASTASPAYRPFRRHALGLEGASTLAPRTRGPRPHPPLRRPQPQPGQRPLHTRRPGGLVPSPPRSALTLAAGPTTSPYEEIRHEDHRRRAVRRQHLPPQRQAPLARFQAADRRRHLRAGRRQPARLRHPADRHPRRVGRAVPGRERPDAPRAALDPPPPRHLGTRRSDRQQRPFRHRHRALGPEREDPQPADLRAARRAVDRPLRVYANGWYTNPGTPEQNADEAREVVERASTP